MGTPVHCCCGALPAVFSPAVVLLDKTSQGLFLHKYLPKKPRQTPKLQSCPSYSDILQPLAIAARLPTKYQ